MFKILLVAHLVLAFYVCWLGWAVFVSSAHSGSDIRFTFKDLKSKLEREEKITLKQLTEAEELISSRSQIRTRKYDDLAIQIGIAGMIQVLLALSLLICRNRAAKTDRSDT